MDKTTVMSLLTMYDLLPKPDNTHFTEDRNRNRALETLYAACNLKH